MDKVSILNIDLSPFSLGRPRAWASGNVIFLSLLGWFMLLILLAAAGPLALALALGGLTIAAVLVSFVATSVQRLSSSTVGRKRTCYRPEDAACRPPHFAATLGEIAAAAERFASAPAPTEGPAPEDPDKASKRIRATLYVVLGVLIVAICIPLWIAARPGGALLPLGIILPIAAMYWAFTRARRVLQRSATLALQQDTRTPILFLRSFRDDKTKVKQRVRLLGLPGEQPIRLEEAMGAVIRRYGPFFAVGEPGEGLPQLGAARTYLPKDRWQDTVLGWIRTSRLTVMLCGPTAFIDWELQKVVEANRLDRLLLLVPPGRKAGASREAKARQARWDNVARSLAATPFGPALGAIDITTLLLVQFRPNGELLAYRSTHDLVQDYELALTLALHAALAGGR